MHIWFQRAIFVLIALVIMMFQLVPQSMEPRMITIPWPLGNMAPWQFAYAPPDICLAVTFVWVIRRPDYAPVGIIAALFLIGDLIFQRPPGLWAAFVIFITERMRRRHSEYRTMTFAVEWGNAALGMIAITLFYRLILAVFMVPLAPWGLSLLQLILTIAVYPLVVIIAHYGFGISRIIPGDSNSKGQFI